MSTAKHLSLQKFEPVDMSLRNAITLRPRASGVHGGIIPIDAIGETLEFGDKTLFRSLQPRIQFLCSPLFEYGHKFLTQEIDGVQVRTCLTDRLKLLSLLGGQLHGRAKSSERTLLARKDGAGLFARRDAVWVDSPATVWVAALPSTQRASCAAPIDIPYSRAL